MRIHLIAVGTRMPEWVQAGYAEYARRLPPHCRLELVEVAAARRGKNQNVADIERWLAEEGERLLKATPADAEVVALERTGKALDTAGWARALEAWLAGGRDVALLVGGPEGLAPSCVQHAAQVWSLSALTLAHPLVRVVVAEQLYRAWSVVAGLPYHR